MLPELATNDDEEERVSIAFCILTFMVEGFDIIAVDDVGKRMLITHSKTSI